MIVKDAITPRVIITTQLQENALRDNHFILSWSNLNEKTCLFPIIIRSCCMVLLAN
jgi:hypothetical protein